MIAVICVGYFAATVYGCGSYFAKYSWYSAYPIYARPNSEGYQFVMQTRVLTGDYCKGEREYIAAPPKNATQRYDSVVNQMRDPYVFVVFDDAAAYPDYILKFVALKT